MTTESVPRPQGLNLNLTPDGMQASFRWWKPQYAFLGVFCLFCNGILLAWYVSVLTDPQASPVLLYGPLFHVAASLALTYVTAAGFLNSTRIAVADGRLTRSHGPLPWPGRQSLELQRLTDVSVSLRPARRGKPEARLWVRDQDGRQTVLLSGLASVEAMRYLQQEIQRRLV